MLGEQYGLDLPITRYFYDKMKSNKQLGLATKEVGKVITFLSFLKINVHFTISYSKL